MTDEYYHLKEYEKLEKAIVLVDDALKDYEGIGILYLIHTGHTEEYNLLKQILSDYGRLDNGTA